MPDVGRRPIVVLSRDAAIPRLRRALVAPCTTTIRNLPSDDPIRWRLEDPRRAQTNVISDWLWLRVLDIQNPTEPEEVGFFDTVPFGDDSPRFDGSWSNYPYFKSGVIIVTSMNEGLFVVKKKISRVAVFSQSVHMRVFYKKQIIRSFFFKIFFSILNFQI